MDLLANLKASEDTSVPRNAMSTENGNSTPPPEQKTEMVEKKSISELDSELDSLQFADNVHSLDDSDFESPIPADSPGQQFSQDTGDILSDGHPESEQHPSPNDAYVSMQGETLADVETSSDHNSPHRESETFSSAVRELEALSSLSPQPDALSSLPSQLDALSSPPSDLDAFSSPPSDLDALSNPPPDLDALTSPPPPDALSSTSPQLEVLSSTSRSVNSREKIEEEEHLTDLPVEEIEHPSDLLTTGDAVHTSDAQGSDVQPTHSPQDSAPLSDPKSNSDDDSFKFDEIQDQDSLEIPLETDNTATQSNEIEPTESIQTNTAETDPSKGTYEQSIEFGDDQEVVSQGSSPMVTSQSDDNTRLVQDDPAKTAEVSTFGFDNKNDSEDDSAAESSLSTEPTQAKQGDSTQIDCDPLPEEHASQNDSLPTSQHSPTQSDFKSSTSDDSGVGFDNGDGDATQSHVSAKLTPEIQDKAAPSDSIHHDSVQGDAPKQDSSAQESQDTPPLNDSTPNIGDDWSVVFGHDTQASASASPQPAHTKQQDSKHEDLGEQAQDHSKQNDYTQPTLDSSTQGDSAMNTGDDNGVGFNEDGSTMPSGESTHPTQIREDDFAQKPNDFNQQLQVFTEPSDSTQPSLDTSAQTDSALDPCDGQGFEFHDDDDSATQSGPCTESPHREQDGSVLNDSRSLTLDSSSSRSDISAQHDPNSPPPDISTNDSAQNVDGDGDGCGFGFDDEDDHQIEIKPGASVHNDSDQMAQGVIEQNDPAQPSPGTFAQPSLDTSAQHLPDTSAQKDSAPKTGDNRDFESHGDGGDATEPGPSTPPPQTEQGDSTHNDSNSPTQDVHPQNDSSSPPPDISTDSAQNVDGDGDDWGFGFDDEDELPTEINPETPINNDSNRTSQDVTEHNDPTQPSPDTSAQPSLDTATQSPPDTSTQNDSAPNTDDGWDFEFHDEVGDVVSGPSAPHQTEQGDSAHNDSNSPTHDVVVQNNSNPPSPHISTQNASTSPPPDISAQNDSALSADDGGDDWGFGFDEEDNVVQSSESSQPTRTKSEDSQPTGSGQLQGISATHESRDTSPNDTVLNTGDDWGFDFEEDNQQTTQLSPSEAKQDRSTKNDSMKSDDDWGFADDDDGQEESSLVSQSQTAANITKPSTNAQPTQHSQDNSKPKDSTKNYDEEWGFGFDDEDAKEVSQTQDLSTESSPDKPSEKVQSKSDDSHNEPSSGEAPDPNIDSEDSKTPNYIIDVRRVLSKVDSHEFGTAAAKYVCEHVFGNSHQFKEPSQHLDSWTSGAPAFQQLFKSEKLSRSTVPGAVLRCPFCPNGSQSVNLSPSSLQICLSCGSSLPTTSRSSFLQSVPSRSSSSSKRYRWRGSATEKKLIESVGFEVQRPKDKETSASDSESRRRESDSETSGTNSTRATQEFPKQTWDHQDTKMVDGLLEIFGGTTQTDLETGMSTESKSEFQTEQTSDLFMNDLMTFAGGSQSSDDAKADEGQLSDSKSSLKSVSFPAASNIVVGNVENSSDFEMLIASLPDLSFMLSDKIVIKNS